MAEKKTNPKFYLATVGVENSKTGARFEPGETVPFDAFPPAVVETWLAQGILSEVTDGDRED